MGNGNLLNLRFKVGAYPVHDLFGIHMAAFNPKPWFKQPAGIKVSINKI